MSSTNGVHPPLANETAKRLPSTSSTSSTSSNSITATNKRLKAKAIVSTIPEIRRRKKHQKKKRLSQNDKNNNHPGKKSQNLLAHQQHPILHPKKSASQSENIPSLLTSHHHHYHGVNNDHCDSCGELYGEMISCDTCPATFHLLCANPPLSREDVPKGSYFCENCRAKSAEERARPFVFDPKSKIATNGVKKSANLGQIKLPTASNGRSLIQPSGDIKFRATNNTLKSNLKRKRLDSATLAPSTSHAVKMPTMQIESLKKLLLSSRPEEFRGPALPFEDASYNRDTFFQKDSLSWQKFCFVCRKSSTSHLPSIHCDYCPLTYHLDCLNPPLTSLPSTNEKWMCPNHIEPILDRYLFSKKKFSTSERVKIYRQYSQIEPKTIIQEFTHMRQTKTHLITRPHHEQPRLERIEVSQIPKAIEQFYINANSKHQQSEQKPFEEEQSAAEEEEELSSVQTESSNEYDPCVWDILQSILAHIADIHPYEYALFNENDSTRKPIANAETTILDRIDGLLEKLNEPNYTIENNRTVNDPFAALVAAADSCFNDANSITNSILPTNSLSLLIDLSQFRLSHAALIHTRSKHVIYIRKQVIWFGSSKSNEICLKNFNHEQSCQYISEKHACLYYDRKRNVFELLNYSEHGTVVNGLRYGLGNLSEDEDDEGDHEEVRLENASLQRCFCLSTPLYHSAWDGAAQLEQGTVVQLGCHEFLFYRHVVR